MHEEKGKPPLPPSAGNTGKKDLLFGVILLLLKGGGDLGHLVTTVAQPMLVTLS